MNDLSQYTPILIGISLAFFALKEAIKLIKELIKWVSPKRTALDVGLSIEGLLKVLAKGHQELKDGQKDQLGVNYKIKKTVESIDHTVQKDHGKFGKLVSDVGIIASETSADAHRNDKNFGILGEKFEKVGNNIAEKVERVNGNMVEFRIVQEKMLAK